MPDFPAPALLSALALLLLACPKPAEEVEEAAPERAVPVETVAAATARVTDPVRVTGMLGPRQDVVVSSEGSGRVLEVAVNLGDAVQKGDVLARLDSTVSAAQVLQARAGLKQAQAQAALAQAGFDRDQKLLGSGATTSSQHYTSEVQLSAAAAAVDSAQASVRLAERSLSDATVRAPFAGLVASVQLEVGALVGPGTPAFRLVDLGMVVVDVGIPAGQILDVRPGLPARVQIPALNEQSVEGVLAHLGPEPDPRTRSYPAEIHVPNPDGRLRSGMVARVAIVVAERQAVVIPETALVGRDPAEVFVVVDGRAERRVPELGRIDNGRVEVRSGIAAGEQVATLGNRGLHDGALVERYELPGPADGTPEASTSAPAPPTPPGG